MDQKTLEQREAELKRREEELEKKEAELAGGGNWLYDKINVPIKYLDIFIGACAVAIVVFLVLGVMKGRGAF